MTSRRRHRPSSGTHVQHDMWGTSMEANAAAEESGASKKARALVLEFIRARGSAGATDREVTDALVRRHGKTKDSWAPARHHLWRELAVVATPLRRATAGHRDGIVWKAQEFTTADEMAYGRARWVEMFPFLEARVLAAMEAVRKYREEGYSELACMALEDLSADGMLDRLLLAARSKSRRMR